MNAPVKEERLIHVEESRARRVDPAAHPLTIHIGGDASSLLAAITGAASNPNVDVNKVKELFQMHQIVLAQQQEAAFNDAMAKAQEEMQPVAHNAENKHTHSTYAKLEAIDKAITTIHTKYGLSITYDTETKNDADPVPPGEIRIVAFVRHSGGHKVRHHIDLPPDDAGSEGNKNKTKVQARCSTNTYGRRFLKMMAFNISTFNDKDGNSTRGRRDQDEPHGAGERAEPGGKAEYPAKEFLKNLPEWKQLMETKKRTADQIIATAESKYALSEGQKQRIRSAGGSK